MLLLWLDETFSIWHFVYLYLLSIAFQRCKKKEMTTNSQRIKKQSKKIEWMNAKQPITLWADHTIKVGPFSIRWFVRRVILPIIWQLHANNFLFKLLYVKLIVTLIPVFSLLRKNTHYCANLWTTTKNIHEWHYSFFLSFSLCLRSFLRVYVFAYMYVAL